MTARSGSGVTLQTPTDCGRVERGICTRLAR